MTRFIAKTRELFDRFDPKYVAFKRRVANFRYPSVKMGSLLSEPPEYGAGEAGIERLNDTTPRYIRITDIDENGELLPGLGMTAANVEPQYFLRDEDLLFARSGNTVGKSYLHESERVSYPCFYAGYMIRFRFGEKVLPKYVFAFAQTPYYHEWVSAIQRSAGQPNINAQEYRSLEIPLPPLPEQRKIVAELDAAYAAKRAADEKATKLLASIDEMVLKELGIANLPKPDTSLSSRIFTVPAREVHNGRLDAYYYKGNFKELNKKLSCCNCVPFGRLITEIYNGIDCRDYKESGVPYLKVANVKPGEFDFDDLKYIDSQEVGAKDIALRAGRMLLTRKGTFGNAIALSEDYDYAISSEVFCLSIKNELVDVHYLETFVNSSIGRMLCDKYKIGAIMGSLSQEAVKALPIPLPDAKVQHRIASRASSIRAEARKLKADVTAALNAAKRKIEEELIGKES